MLPLKAIRLSGKREALVGSYMIFFFLFLSLETGTHYVALAGLKLRNPPASASLMLGFKKLGPTMPSSYRILEAEEQQTDKVQRMFFK